LLFSRCWWENKFLAGLEVSSQNPAWGIKIGVRTAGFNNPAGWALGHDNGAVNLLEPADAFNIPVPDRGTEGGNENVDYHGARACAG
jgi:hypothetical protein